MHKEMILTVIDMIAIAMRNYPETIHSLAVVNAPRIFSLAWAMIKPFLDERVLRKISISAQPDTDRLLRRWGSVSCVYCKTTAVT